MYRRLSVEVTQPRYLSQRDSEGRCKTEAVIGHKNTCAKNDSVTGNPRNGNATYVFIILNV
jgi:hypothetical protein